VWAEERKREIPSKRQDDPWPWLKRGESRSRGATEGVAYKVQPCILSTRCEWHCTSPSSNSSPRLLIFSPVTPSRKCLGRRVASFLALPGNQDPLSVAWAHVARKIHGEGSVPIALSDHGHPTSRCQYKTDPSPKKLPPPPSPHSPSRSGWLRAIVRS